MCVETGDSGMLIRSREMYIHFPHTVHKHACVRSTLGRPNIIVAYDFFSITHFNGAKHVNQRYYIRLDVK